MMNPKMAVQEDKTIISMESLRKIKMMTTMVVNQLKMKGVILPVKRSSKVMRKEAARAETK